MNLYKALWSRIGGRPWTHIYRWIWRNLEYFVQALWFFTGLGVYHYLGWLGVLLFWIFYSYGYINGHFFWAKPWEAYPKPPEQGE